MVYDIKDADSVKIAFFAEDGVSEFASLSISYADFLTLLPKKADLNGLGLVVFSADFKEFAKVPSLNLCNTCTYEIGRSIAVIGFQLEHGNMALKTGIISSNFTNSKGYGFIQYDGTVIAGYSGSPLLDYTTGDVVGVVMNKETTFVKSYRELMDIIDMNLKTLKDQEGKEAYMDVDLAQVLFAGQNQIKHIVREFFLHATVKVGLALEISHLLEYMETRNDFDPDAVNYYD